MIGTQVSHYEILSEVGGGGMGTVYQARDTRLGRLVALKFLPVGWSSDADARERFSREARAASAIDHPHICTVYDIGETDDGRMYIAMAFCRGENLARRIDRGPFPVETAVDVAIQAAEALAAAHEAGIVHRDIKPANLLIDSRNQVKIVDFGLAKLVGGAGVTRAGVAIGTPAYMSPEQAEGRSVDHTTDLWSLGAVLYEMLSGERAFSGDSDHAVMYSVVNTPPTSLAELRPDLPDELVAIVDRCLEKRPGDRYPDAAALLADLRRLRGEASPYDGRTVTLHDGTGIRRRLPRTGTLVVVAAVAVVVAAVVVGLQKSGPAPPLPEEKTLVVLPFTSPDGDSPAAAALGDGLMDQVTRSLAGMRRFRDTLNVIPASIVRRERVSEPDAALLAFGATLAVHGTIEADRGGVLRILLELIDTRADRAMRRRTVPWVVGQGETLQHRLVAALAEMLELELDEPTRTAIATGGTMDREAQALHLQALGEVDLDASIRSLDDAADLLRQALEYDPTFTLARADLAAVSRRRAALSGEPAWTRAALGYARRAVEEDPLLPRARVVLGQVMADLGMTAEGLDEVDSALDLDPLNMDALRTRAALYERAGERDRARATYDEALALRPDDWTIVANAGGFYFDELDFATAAAYFRRLVELRPDTAWAWSNLGGALFRSGDLEQARAAFDRSIAIGETYEGLSNLGTLEFYQGEYAAATPLFERALAIDDGDWRVWNNLAESLRFGGGDPARVRDAYDRTAVLASAELERHPGDPGLTLVVASASAATGDTGRARGLTDRVVAAGIEDPTLMMMTASVEEQLGQRQRALDWLARAVAGGFPMAEIESYPGFAGLRTDPGFDDVRRAAP